jgi:endonuclease/exonuclease/phosphatase (EEP) superfamily protein YafD
VTEYQAVCVADMMSEESALQPGVQRPLLRWVGNLLIAAGLVPVAVYFFSLLGSQYFLAELAVNFRLQLLVLLVPCPVLLLLLRRFALALALGAVTLACAFPVAGVWLDGKQPPAGPETWRLMSFNVLAGNTRFEEVLAEVRRHDPDVLVVLELTDAWATVLGGLKNDYPWSVVEPRWHGYGIGLYSKRPILQSAVRQLTRTGTDNPAIDARIDFGDTPVQVMAAHFSSPGIQLRMRLRNQQMHEIVQYLEPQVPCLLAGDLNCTPYSRQFGRLLATSGLRDSRKGFGYHGSFPTDPWLIRIPIDHVLVSSTVHVAGRFLGEAGGSDHFPVICDFSISGPAPAK